MAPLITHLVIGERVFLQWQRFDPADYGSFLLGCILVDVHFCGSIDRCRTHFAERLAIDGDNGFNRSCANFLEQLGDLLARPWDELKSPGRAFVAGYLCHLAADEDWKRFDWNVLQTLGMRWWIELPVPVSVLLTAFDVLSSRLYADQRAVASALSGASVPDVLTHIPHSAFQAMWNIVKAHAMDGSTPESYFDVLQQMGKTDAEIQVARHQHQAYWEDAIALMQDFFGDVPSRVQAMVQRSLEVMPQLRA